MISEAPYHTTRYPVRTGRFMELGFEPWPSPGLDLAHLPRSPFTFHSVVCVRASPYPDQ